MYGILPGKYFLLLRKYGFRHPQHLLLRANNQNVAQTESREPQRLPLEAVAGNGGGGSWGRAGSPVSSIT
ncbi:hypothetical protein [uncultured Acetobacteroides sp.]|uniref:hypothetical protein n=1 Tax=uncultured Acetobacteroides sp. TaxID=1760811 RepID=UPI0029F47190|nr:hypothetical protein [uncultured Acetobacteroides sp.]